MDDGSSSEDKKESVHKITPNNNMIKELINDIIKDIVDKKHKKVL